MQIVRLAAPWTYYRAVLNTGEVVGVPDDIAAGLVSSGAATLVEVKTTALDGPPANKMMTPNHKKHFHRSRRHGATSGD